MTNPQQTSQQIPLSGGLILIILCLIWGGNFVSIKVSNEGIPPLLTATIRSCVAALLLWAYARAAGEKVFLPRRVSIHGIVIGLLFGTEFLFLYWGLSFTHASRAIILLYTNPLWTALLAHFVLRDDRLHVSKTAGICVAFAGLVFVFGSRSGASGQFLWIGDLMELIAGFLWALTTIYIKRFASGSSVSHFQTLFAQLFYSIPLLAIASFVLESYHALSLAPIIMAALVYQCVVVAFVSYLAWFRMIHRYPASRLAAFTFLAPVFGVILSGAVLQEPIPPGVWMGLVSVAGGIYLVNRPAPSS